MNRTLSRRPVLTGLLASALFASSTFADVPRLIQYQGKLVGSNGAALAGPVSLRVRLYADPTNPTPLLFDETHAVVPLTRGLFSILVGSNTGGGVPDAAVTAPAIYLGVAMDGGAEFSPRRQIVTTPYTLKSRSAEVIVKPGTADAALSADSDGRISIGGGSADASAALDVSSTTGGFLPPRMTTAQRNAISNPVPGLLVYDVDTNCLNMWTGVGWTVMGAPPPAAAISGPSNVCANSMGVVYSTGDVGAAEYSWTVPPGATIVNGQGTAFLTMNFGVTSGNLGVTPSNACGTSASSILPVFVETQPPPATPGPVSGPGCGIATGASGIVYSISAVPGAAMYTWSVPSDATITAGQGTISITVTFGSASGNIVVNASNGCGISADRVYAVSVGANTSGPGSQTFVANGSGPTGTIQQFTVPAGVICLTIEAWGAEGGNGAAGAGGRGARMRGAVSVTPGETLKIIVGQRPPTGNNGGGGGTFVTRSDDSPLVIAGGGGGNAAADSPNKDAVIATTGQNGGGSTFGAGGLNGNGGAASPQAGGGGGLLTNGGTGGGQEGGRAFVNGGGGGTTSGVGGFGGGGSGTGSSGGGGGGGGYSGGGGADGFAGGGGGSFNSGSNQSNSSGVQLGDGQVVFSW